MSRASDAANAVVYAVEQVLNLYGVRHTREQSRVVNVADDRRPGGYRPMYFGKWIDDDGNVHSSGRADILARPRIMIPTGSPYGSLAEVISVPLWIECKSGKGTLNPDQRAFRAWVQANGDPYLLIHDDVRPLIEWLDSHGVKKEPKSIVHAEPMTPIQVDHLLCRHCDKALSEHLNAIKACPTSKALGKVWSPNLKVQGK